jgi:arsenite-transporting ATPase
MERNEYDRYVLDLAPTGHALRFLEMPGMARQWFITFTRLLLKYQGVVSLTRVAEWVRGKSKQLRRVEQILVDSARCEFIAVTIPEEMAVQETGRLIERLRTLGVDCRWTVANMVVHSGACLFCEAIRNQQQQHLAELTRLAGDNADAGAVVPVPLFPYEIRTVDRLAEVAGILYGAGVA